MNLKPLFDLYRFYKAYREVKKKMSEVKQGKSTSELYVLIANIIVQIVGVMAGKIPAETSAMIVAILSGLYIIGRSIVKLTATKTDDMIVDKIGEIIVKMGGQKPK